MLNIVLTMLLAAVPLVEAVRSGDRAAAIKMLEQRVDVNAPEADGTTALHWAVQQDDLDLVGRLINAGANVKAKNDYGATPMSEAALAGNVKIMDRLLEAGADVESPNADGQTALMIVARTSNVEAARLLLKHGANVNAVEKWREQTALMWAAAENQPAMVKELVAHGANVNARSNVNNFQRQVTAEPRAIYRPAGGLTSPAIIAAPAACRKRGQAWYCEPGGRRSRLEHGGSGLRQPLAPRDSQRSLRCRGVPDWEGRQPKQVGLVGPEPAVCCCGLEHDSSRRQAGSPVAG